MNFCKVFIIILALLMVIFSGALLYAVVFPPHGHGTVCLKNHCFDVQLATTPAEQVKGLMFQNHLAANQGMLFVFSKEGNYSFWMKNTLIPLDIIWINGNGNTVFMSQNTLPCRRADCPIIKPAENAEYVLEINAGNVQNIGIHLGDKVAIKI